MPSGKLQSFPVVSGRFASNLAQFQHNPVWYRVRGGTDASACDVTGAVLGRREEVRHA